MIIEIATLLAIAVIGTIILYTMARFRDWVSVNVGNFRNRQLLSGLVRERLSNGNNKVVSFLFDRKTDAYVKAEAYEAKMLDEELEEKLEEKEVFIQEVKVSS